jgi:hypothetical protein
VDDSLWSGHIAEESNFGNYFGYVALFRPDVPLFRPQVLFRGWRYFASWGLDMRWLGLGEKVLSLTAL